MPQTHCLITGQRRKMFCRAGKGSKNAPKRKKAFLNLVVFGFLQPVVNVHASAHGSRPGFFFIVRVPGIGRNRHAGYVRHRFFAARDGEVVCLPVGKLYVKNLKLTVPSRLVCGGVKWDTGVKHYVAAPASADLVIEHPGQI